MLHSHNKKAFSLIEVIIAASILSVTVFWVYKLIWENAKLINNSWNYLQLNTLFPALEECMKSKPMSIYPNSWTIKFNFWSDLNWCEISIPTSTGVTIDNIEYILEWKIIDNQSPEYIDWELKIEWDWVGTSTGTFKLIK